jgi:hypothetical protein
MFTANYVYLFGLVHPTCVLCVRSVTIEEDLQCLSGQLALLYESIHVFCKYNDIGCEAILTLTSCSDHEHSSRFGKYPAKLLTNKNKSKGSSNLDKEHIYDCKKKYIRQKRLKPVIDYIIELKKKTHKKKQNNENKCDVLFFALHDSLRETNDPRINMIDNAWKNKSQTLDAQECLAMSVDTL